MCLYSRELVIRQQLLFCLAMLIKKYLFRWQFCTIKVCCIYARFTVLRTVSQSQRLFFSSQGTILVVLNVDWSTWNLKLFTNLQGSRTLPGDCTSHFEDDVFVHPLRYNGRIMTHGHSRQIPFVFVSPSEMFGPFSGARMGNPVFSSIDYNPMLGFRNPKTFLQRLISVAADCGFLGMHQYFDYRWVESVVAEFISRRDRNKHRNHYRTYL